jgi:hypothetical protein
VGVAEEATPDGLPNAGVIEFCRQPTNCGVARHRGHVSRDSADNFGVGPAGPVGADVVLGDGFAGAGEDSDVAVVDEDEDVLSSVGSPAS